MSTFALGSITGIYLMAKQQETRRVLGLVGFSFVASLYPTYKGISYQTLVGKLKKNLPLFKRIKSDFFIWENNCYKNYQENIQIE